MFLEQHNKYSEWTGKERKRLSYGQAPLWLHTTLQQTPSKYVRFQVEECDG